MIVFIYDGTPMGLATAAAAALHAEAAGPDTISLAPRGRFRPNLFAEARVIETDYPAAMALWRDLEAHLPFELWREVFVCFFTGEPDMEDPLLAYIRQLLRTGGRAAEDWTDGTVRRIRQLSMRVRHEIHRLHGFIRFERLPNGLYYSQVTPDHPVLPLLAPHFAARFADQAWLIHDLKRNTGIYYDGSHWAFLPAVEMPTAPQKSIAVQDPHEEICRELWREYHETIAVKERANPRLQKQRMPVRYWGNMTEMRDKPPGAPPPDKGANQVHAAEGRAPYGAGSTEDQTKE